MHSDDVVVLVSRGGALGMGAVARLKGAGRGRGRRGDMHT